MSKFTTKFNRSNRFEVETEGFEYKSLKDLVTEAGGEVEIHPVNAIYINTKGKYGDAPTIATNDCFVNLPSHMTTTCKEILSDDEAVQEIKDGKVGFSIYTFESHGKDCFNIRWEDYQPKEKEPEKPAKQAKHSK